MTHVPFTSRLASLIGLPTTRPPSPKYDGTDDYYIPYTGTFEPPPSSSAGHGRTHAHTLSGSTKGAPSSYSVTTSHPHPYNPDRFVYLPSQGTATTATFAEEQDRGRQRKPRPMSTSSSFAALSPSSEQLHVFPSTTMTPTAKPVLNVHPPSTVRKTAPSYLPLDGGFIGQSPVATVPPRDKDSVRNDKHERPGYRSSFASFMTFGNSRKSVSTGSGPLSAQATTFPHGASKLRGEARQDSDDDEGLSFIHPILPAFMRQRSQSYVDQTEQTQEVRRRKEQSSQSERGPGDDPAHRDDRFHSVRVMMPTSFFDTSPFDERNDPYRRPIRFEETRPPAPTEQPHPYRQHYRKSIEAPAPPMINLGSPVSPSFEFLHPYASASGHSHSPPSKSIHQYKGTSLRQQAPPQTVPDSPIRVNPPQGSFPFINPFAEPPYRPSPPTSRPVTPKNRLRALASDGLKTLKGSISTPNLRAFTRLQSTSETSQSGNNAGPTGGESSGTHLHQSSKLTKVSHAKSSVRTPSDVVLQGQTICDTFFFPRPRFQAHQISPPDSPYGGTYKTDPDSVDPLEGSWKTRGRRGTEVAIESVDDARTETKSLGKRKGSAPDLRKPRRPALQEMRRLTAAEIALQEGEAAQKEREEWADAARRSFQNQRSRSLSRSRTKSIAKASNAAITASTPAGVAAEEKERERARKRAAVGGGPSSVAHTAPNESAPPTASSNGVGTTGDDGRPRTGDKNTKGVTLKGGMDIIAQRAFSQGHVAVVSTASSVSHSRHHSGETLKEKSKEQGHRHRRSESWGRSAVKRAKSVCVDPESFSPAIERVLYSGPPVETGPETSQEAGVLNITSQTRPQTPKIEDDNEVTSSAVGIAIGTPPMDSLFNNPAKRIEHPYGSALNSPTRPSTGPHPTSPVLTALPTQLTMSDVESRHRLPPRALNAVSPPRSPPMSPRLKGLDPFAPNLASTQQETVSRESWLVYMDAMEGNSERPFTAAEKGKGRAVVVEDPVPEEYEQQFPEDVEAHMDAHNSHLDHNSEGTPLRMLQKKTPSPQELQDHLTKAFRQSTASTGGDSEGEDDEHANMTFQAGATLTRLLSSRSVTATPRPALIRALSNPETPKRKERLLPESESFSTVAQTPKRPPFPTFYSEKVPAESSPAGSDVRPKSDASDPLSASLENSWRKSVVSSEGAAHSQESSPKASPRALVNLDDLDGYSDLFYQAGPGSTGSRPRSGGSFKTVNSGGLSEKNRRSDIITFGPKGASGSSSLDRSLSSPESGRSPLSIPGSSAYPAMPSFKEYGDTARGYTDPEPSRLTDPYLLRTWDPEEEDDHYRIVNSRPALLPRPVAPIHRYSTKLSVIEGSIDDHATASESTPDPTDAQSMRAVSPTSPTMSETRTSMQPSSTLPVLVDSLGIPVYSRPRRTSSERAVAPDGALRTSVLTNISDQSRMSNLSEFPAPPLGSSSLVFTPATTMVTYFPPRPASPAPVSPLSVEPPSPVVETVDDDEISVSDHQHNLSAANRNANSRSGSFRANRSTFGPDTEITREWAEQNIPSTPTTEER